MRPAPLTTLFPSASLLLRFAAACFSVALCVTATPPAFAAPHPAPAKPALRIPLDGLGYRPTTAVMLMREGFARNTLDFIDNEHVLLTFTAHKLVPRDSEDMEGDQARLIEAVVVHLPDGEVLRQAEWRVHDEARYLWPLTHGRFMLRVRNKLFFVDPMRPHEIMHRHTLLEPDGELAAVQVSPDGATVMVETTPKRHIGDDPTQPLENQPVLATFYRVSDDDHPQLRAFATSHLDRAVLIPFTSRGLLDVSQEDRQHWGFDFHPFSGGKIELAGLTSTCRPEAEFISESTFVATGCRGMDDRRLFSGFDLLAQANWVFTTDDPPLWSALSTASGDSGRFAFRNAQAPTVTSSSDEEAPQDHHTQIVRVYDFQGGTEILRVPVTPAQRAGLNFDLSPDGQHLAVLQDRMLEVYDLPAVSPGSLREQAREQAAAQKIPLPKPGRVAVENAASASAGNDPTSPASDAQLSHAGRVPTGADAPAPAASGAASQDGAASQTTAAQPHSAASTAKAAASAASEPAAQPAPDDPPQTPPTLRYPNEPKN